MKASNEHLYLSGGNEARLKKAWENRDPRLNYNVIMPYGEEFLGGDGDMYKAGNTTPVPYVYRWPGKTVKPFCESAGGCRLGSNR